MRLLTDLSIDWSVLLCKNVQSQFNYDVNICCYRNTYYWAVIFFFKLATNAYHDDQQLLLLGDRILRCLCGLPLFDLNPRSSALKVNVLTIGPPRITIIIKSKVNIVFKKNEQWIVVWCLYNCVILAYCRHETIFCIRFSIYQI